jgi:transposase
VRQRVYFKDVAAELGVHHPSTVSRARKRGDAPPRQRSPERSSKLDRYKPEIDRLLAAGVWNAVVILREIQAQGYRGQASILRDYIRSKRPLRQARATVRFETAPGEQLQTDQAQYRTVVSGRAQEVHSRLTLALFAPFPFRGDGVRGRRTHLRELDPEFRVFRRRDQWGSGR